MLKNGSFNFNPEKKTLNKVLIFDINKTKEEQIMHDLQVYQKLTMRFLQKTRQVQMFLCSKKKTKKKKKKKNIRKLVFQRVQKIFLKSLKQMIKAFYSLKKKIIIEVVINGLLQDTFYMRQSHFKKSPQ